MIGVCNFGAHTLLDKIQLPDVSMIVEADIDLGSLSITSDDICCKSRSISCCCVWRKVNLVDYVLSYLRLQELYYTILQALDVDVEVIFNVSSVLNIKF